MGTFSVLGGIVVAIWDFFGRKLVTVISTGAAFIGLLFAFLLCIKLLIAKIAAVLVIPAFLSSSVLMFVPSNWAFLLASIASAHSCRAAFQYAIYKLKMINDAH